MKCLYFYMKINFYDEYFKTKIIKKTVLKIINIFLNVRNGKIKKKSCLTQRFSWKVLFWDELKAH